LWSSTFSWEPSECWWCWISWHLLKHIGCSCLVKLSLFSQIVHLILSLPYVPPRFSVSELFLVKSDHIIAVLWSWIELLRPFATYPPRKPASQHDFSCRHVQLLEKVCHNFSANNIWVTWIAVKRLNVLFGSITTWMLVILGQVSFTCTICLLGRSQIIGCLVRLSFFMIVRLLILSWTCISLMFLSSLLLLPCYSAQLVTDAFYYLFHACESFIHIQHSLSYHYPVCL